MLLPSAGYTQLTGQFVSFFIWRANEIGCVSGIFFRVVMNCRARLSNCGTRATSGTPTMSVVQGSVRRNQWIKNKNSSVNADTYET
jgi:hypothetical protein